jgi:uncharacterized UBP type Zn finger protein
MEWLFQHMEDPDIDAPLDLSSGAGTSGAAADPEKIETLGAMGFGPPQARQALKETGGDMERAVEWLFNHPDAQGDFEDGTPAASDAAPREPPGKSDLPAEFQLNSIICHKGTSVHTGYVLCSPSLLHSIFHPYIYQILTAYYLQTLRGVHSERDPRRGDHRMGAVQRREGRQGR